MKEWIILDVHYKVHPIHMVGRDSSYGYYIIRIVRPEFAPTIAYASYMLRRPMSACTSILDAKVPFIDAKSSRGIKVIQTNLDVFTTTLHTIWWYDHTTHSLVIRQTTHSLVTSHNIMLYCF